MHRTEGCFRAQVCSTHHKCALRSPHVELIYIFGLNTNYEFPGITCDNPDTKRMNAPGKTGIAVPGHRWKIVAARSTGRDHESIKYCFIYIYVTRTHRCYSPDLIRREFQNSIPNTADNEREDGVVFAFKARDV